MNAASDTRICLADPTGQIERECAEPSMKQKDVALTYALAIRDESIVPVDWTRANAAIAKRWPKGLSRVKEKAWKHFAASPRTTHPSPQEHERK